MSDETTTAADSLVFRFMEARDDLIAAHICPICLNSDAVILDVIEHDFGQGIVTGEALVCDVCTAILGNDRREIYRWREGF